MSSSIYPAAILQDAASMKRWLPRVDHYAGSYERIQKALALQQTRLTERQEPLFDVTCDCEDGASVGNEREHAQMITDLLLAQEAPSSRVGLRIHDINHPHWLADLATIIPAAGHRLAYVTLPKTRSADEVKRQIAALRTIETDAKLAQPLPVHVLIETPQAVESVWQIAAIADVESLDFGLMDFVAEFAGAIPEAAMQSPLQFSHPLVVRAKTRLASAAAAFGIAATHNVCTELTDSERIASDAATALTQFGFVRMWSIHPNQITPILTALTPSAADIDRAAEILLAAAAANWGPIRHAGKLHDRASYRYYWQRLQTADQMGVSLPTACKRWFDQRQ